MTFVYVLQSLVNGKYYIGSTNNLKRRFIEHNKGKTKYTKLLKPYKIVFQQEFESIKQARKIEYKLKKFKSKRIIKKIVQDKVIKLGS